MRIWWSSIFLFLTLSPSIIGISEVLEHWDHHHATLCHEEGTHMHPLEHHCSVDSGWMWTTDGQIFFPQYHPLHAYSTTPHSQPLIALSDYTFEWKKGRAPPHWMCG